MLGCEHGSAQCCANASYMYKRGEGCGEPNVELAAKYKQEAKDIIENVKNQFNLALNQ